MDRRRAAGVLLALAACVAYATAAPTASNHTSLDLYDGAPDGCYYNFQHYGEGDRIMTNEPCLNCTCHNRMLMCYLRVCPFTKPIGQDCTIEKRADQCCPIVTCPDVPVDLLTSTTTSPAEYGSTGLGKLDKYGCSIHGKYFPEGSKVPPTPNKPCEHCYCIRNMTTCVMQECTLHVDGCTPIYHKDVCCPVRYSCDHPEDEMPLLDDLSTTVRPTPGFLLSTTTLSPVTQMSQDCLYENQIIRDGALIKTEKACDHCYCMKGDIVCVVQECGTPMENEGKNCTALAPREGVCCPDTYICEGDEPTTGTYETDYTTELEKLTTLSPPRRAGSEGSGYRIEPDGAPDVVTPPFETETEGSGYEQATIHPTIVIEEKDKIEFTDEMLSSTVESHDTTTRTQESVHSDVTTESVILQDTESQHYVPTPTSTSSSIYIDESSSTKAQDEDVGSGEEDIVTPYETIPSSSAPAIEESQPTVASDQIVLTTETSKEEDAGIPDKIPTTIASFEDKDKTDIPKEQSVSDVDNVFDLTTRRHLDDDEGVEESTTFDGDYKFTEHDTTQTTSIPIIEDSERKTTKMPEHDEKTIDQHHYAMHSTSAPGFEDDLATTEPQDIATESFDGTVGEFDVHHQIMMTASTPLLEEIEKDTVLDESTPDVAKISSPASNTPTEESIYKDSLKPDLIDETIATNIPTTVSTFEEDVKTTDGHQKTKETSYEDSSEPQQYSPTTSASVFDDRTDKTSTLDTLTTLKSQESQETDIKESSDHDQYELTSSVPVSEDETQKPTSSDVVTTPKIDEGQETDVEKSTKPQQYAPATNSPMLDDDTKETTQSDGMTSSKAQDSQEIDVEESSEPTQYGPTTNVAKFDDETKISTPSVALTPSKTEEGQEIDVEDISEHQQYAPTTSGPVIDDEGKETTSKTQEDQDIDVKESSEPAQYGPTTSVAIFDDETKMSTPSDATTTSKTQEHQKIYVEDGLEPQDVSTTSAPVFEDESMKITPSDALTTSKANEHQETDVEYSSEPQQSVPTTSAPVLEDETKKTTPSDSLTTSKIQEGQEIYIEESSEPQQYAPTTSATLDDDTRKMTPSDAMTTLITQDVQETIIDSSESQEYAPITNAPTFVDEPKKTTSLDIMITSKTGEDQEKDIKESSEPQQYTPTTIVPVFEDETKDISSATTAKHDEITTTEPDKGLNTIPSGSIEEETTESPGVEKHTHIDEVSPTESATELIVDPSVSQEDQLTQSTGSTIKEDVDRTGFTETHHITEQTTIPAEIIRETSTKLPPSDYPDSSSPSVPFNTENEEQSADAEKPITTSSYELSIQTSGTEVPEKHQTEISSPSYTTVPASTMADLEENEIINESRIPGEGDCLLNGVTYRNESAVPSTNKCQSGCRCSSSIIKCDPIICSPPPEYMDNCQTTYDTPNACCPTYVCDHKTETMPPQSHSQMSGTEAPVEAPIKCIGDECVLSEDKKEPMETSEPCDSGSCTGQADPGTQLSNIPEQHPDRKEECTGSLCSSSDSIEPLCNQEDGCQASPVKPCEGTECDSTSDAILPQKPQPCIGDNCDIPVKDCSTGKCDSDDQDKLDIEKECLEKSCKRKDDSELEQQPPKKCSGSECSLTEITTDLGITTADTLDIGTAKIEHASESPYLTTKAIDYNVSDNPDERVTEVDVLSEPLSTTILQEESTRPPALDSDKDKISTIYESVTPSDYEASSAPHLPDSTKVDTKPPISLPDVYPTEKFEYDATTKAADEKHSTEQLDLSVDHKSTTEISRETTTTPKMHTAEQDEDTILSLGQETTTFVSNELDKIYDTEQTTTPQPEKQTPEDMATGVSEDMFTKSPITQDIGSSDGDVISTESSISTDSKLHEATKLPVEGSDDITVAYDNEDVTKVPQVNEEVTTKANEDIGTTSKSYDSEPHVVSDDTTTHQADIIETETSKPHATDLQETTETPKESEGEETTVKVTDEIITQPEAPETIKSPQGSVEIKTESSKPFDSQDTTFPELTQNKMTTSLGDVSTETSKPSDTDAQEITQSSEEPYSKETTSSLDVDTDTQTSKPYEKESHKTTESLEQVESEEATEKSTVTEPSLSFETEEQHYTKSPVAIEYTRKDISDETDTKPTKDDDLSYETTTSQHDSEPDVTITKINDDAATESSEFDESEHISTTKSPSTDIDSEETTTKVMQEIDIKPTKHDGPQAVTQSSETDVVPLLDVATTESSEDDQKLYSEPQSHEKTTPQLPITSEITTQSSLATELKITETEEDEITTRIHEPTESVTVSATGSIEKVTSTSSLSPIDKDEDVTSIPDLDIMTESPLDLVTIPVSHSDVTSSPDKSSEQDETTHAEIQMVTSEQTITKTPYEQKTETPDEDKTTEANVDLDVMTQRPTSISEDEKIQEDVKTDAPNLLETEKDTVSVPTTSKPNDATDLALNVDIKPEQPEPEKDQSAETLEKTTEGTLILEKTTTEATVDLNTKQPVDSEIEPESQTDKPYINKLETSDIDSLEKDQSKTETPLDNERTTVMSEDKTTEIAIEIVKEPETIQNQDITKSTVSEEETYTKVPVHGSSEAEPTHSPDLVDEEMLTTAGIKISETTEPTNILPNTTSKPSGLQDENTETTQKQPLDTAVSQQVEYTSSINSLEDKETQTMVSELSTAQESSTKEQLPTDIYELTTALSKDTYTEFLDADVTTAKPVEHTETEKLYELVTEFVKVTKDTQETTPEEDVFKPSQSTTTESVEITTKMQDQGDIDNVATEIVITKDSTPTTIETTKAPEANEVDVDTSTPKHEFSEVTTVSKVEDERIHIEKESTEIPTTASDKQTVDIITEPEPVLIDTTTRKQETVIEEEFIPSKTERPDMYQTTLSAEEPGKSTLSPVEEAPTGSDQPTSSEPQTTDEGKLSTSAAFDVEKTTTPKAEIEVLTDKVTIPTRTPYQPEPSPVTSAAEEEKPTTAKAEEFSTASPMYTKSTHKPTDAPAAEQPKPIPTEEQPNDDILPPDEEPSIPSSGTSGYGTDPDYMEEDQTFGPGTCRYGGKVYVSAQQIPRDDPCDFCFCFRSDIICLQQSCPPPIHGCHEEPISGFCCPRYECPVSMATTVNVTTTTTTTTTTLPPHFPVHSYKGSAQKRGCLIKGHTYKVGEVVRASSGPCLHCTCGGDGQMKCDPKQCTPEPMLRQMIAAAVSAKRRR